MKSWPRQFVILMLVVTAVAAGSTASDAPGAPAAPGGPAVTSTGGTEDGPAASTTSLPEIGQVLDAVEKATSDQGGDKAGGWSSPVKLAVVFFALALLPSLLVMTTSFTRIVIVLSFVRRALSTQSIPPNVAIIGLALFLTLFTMSSTFGRINDRALNPYLKDEISFPDACSKGNDLLKEFMFRQTRKDDLKLFVEMAGITKPQTIRDLPAHVVIPSFAISEFRRAFEMGCLLFIPFLLIDLVIASILLSAGMMMLPPAMISLPFKLILFVLVDGWRLLAETLVKSFVQ